MALLLPLAAAPFAATTTAATTAADARSSLTYSLAGPCTVATRTDDWRATLRGGLVGGGQRTPRPNEA